MPVIQTRSPGGSTEAKQNDVIAALTVAGIKLDTATLTALENLVVSGTVALDAATLTALENVVVSGAVALDAVTLAALENVVVSGTVAVSNHPADFPNAAAQTTLASILTELGQKLEAGQAVALDAAALAALENITATISGPVALDSATLAALETITAAVTGTVTAEDSGERQYTHVTATVTATGDTTIHTPAAGKAIRLRWIYAINDPTATTATLIKVKLGAAELYRVWALSKRQLSQGAVNAALVVNLSATGTVAVSALLEEV